VNPSEHSCNLTEAEKCIVLRFPSDFLKCPESYLSWFWRGAWLEVQQKFCRLHVCGVCSDGALSRHNHEAGSLRFPMCALVYFIFLPQVQSQPVYNVGSTQPPGMLWWNASGA